MMYWMKKHPFGRALVISCALIAGLALFKFMTAPPSQESPVQTQAAVSSPSQPASKIFLFRYAPSLSGPNYVGNDWNHTCLVNGTPASAGSRFTFSVGDTVVIDIRIVEDDDVPDVGIKRFKHKITAQDMVDGFMMDGSITVTENGGAHQGKKCTWKVSVGFSPFH